MVKRTITPLPKTVKESVDFIYEYLMEHPDGLSFPMKSIVETRTQKRVASILIQRGIIEKTFIPAIGRRGVSYKYKWVAPMAPTKTLYGSIVTEMRNEQSKWPSHKLMDVHDEDIEVMKASGLSNSALYKLAGNSIVCACMEGIFTQLFRTDSDSLF